MGRRYLTRIEIDVALRRGKNVECFIGSCTRNGRPGIRHCTMDIDGDRVRLSVFETTDLGDAAFLDLYRFRPLNDDLELGDADQIQTFGSLDSCLDAMETRWPGCTARLVNVGAVQDEYSDYLENRTS